MSLLVGPQIRLCQGIQSKQIALTMQDKRQKWCQLCLAHQQLHCYTSQKVEHSTVQHCVRTSPLGVMNKGIDVLQIRSTSHFFFPGHLLVWISWSPWGIQMGLSDYFNFRGIMSLWSISLWALRTVSKWDLSRSEFLDTAEAVHGPDTETEEETYSQSKTSETVCLSVRVCVSVRERVTVLSVKINWADKAIRPFVAACMTFPLTAALHCLPSPPATVGLYITPGWSIEITIPVYSRVP